MKKIGIVKNEYPEKRTIIEGNTNKIVKINSRNYYLIRLILNRIPILKNKVDLIFYERPLTTKEVDGVHFFNSITNQDISWVSTFETFIPRSKATDKYKRKDLSSITKKDEKNIEKYLKMISSNNCKKIIALSKINYEMEKYLLDFFPAYKDKILEKMIQINPPQKKLVEKNIVEQKTIGKRINFLFVGKDFIRKGGKEIVDVFWKIKEETDFEFELQLVSLGKEKNYAFGKYQDSETEISIVKNKIDECSFITLHEKLENKDLLKLMKQSDVGLLPTWADTYGYSVLEFQASGCPVITTDVRALPEINNNEIGWIINLDTDDFGEVIIDSKVKKIEQRKSLQEQLERIILDILNNPDQIKNKAIDAYDAVSSNHSLEKYMDKLNEIYEENF